MKIIISGKVVWFDDLKIEQLDMSQNEIVSETNYYPFGLAHKGYNEHVNSTNLGEQFKFNGKEHQNEFDINFTDYGWRNYMSDIGRWISPDPLTEEFSDWSPYNYGMNNPVRYIDVDGLYSTEEWKKDNGITDDDLVTLYSASSNSSSENDPDVRFRDKDGNLLATYHTDKVDTDVYLPVSGSETNLNLNDMLSKVGLEDVDVVGVGGNWDYTFAMGGGKSLEAVYFLDGKNKGEYNFFETKRQNVGLNGGAGIYALAADFHGGDSSLGFSDYLGRTFSLSGGVRGPALSGYSKFWAPQDDLRDKFGFRSLFNKDLRQWSGYTIGGGAGVGGQWSKQHTTLLKK